MGGEEVAPGEAGGAAPAGAPAAAGAPAGAGGWGLMGGLGDLLGEEVQKLREEVELSVEEALGIEPGRPAAATAAAAGPPPPPPGAEAGDGPAGRSRAASGDSAGAAEAAAEGQLARLQRRNEELMHQLAAVDAGETAAVVEEASRRVHDSERKIIRLQRERDKCVAFAAANAPPAPRRPDPFARR